MYKDGRLSVLLVGIGVMVFLAGCDVALAPRTTRSEDGLSSRSKEIQNYRSGRQGEAQQLMQEQMMGGNFKGKRPGQAGPPGGGAP